MNLTKIYFSGDFPLVLEQLCFSNYVFQHFYHGVGFDVFTTLFGESRVEFVMPAYNKVYDYEGIGMDLIENFSFKLQMRILLYQMRILLYQRTMSPLKMRSL